MFKCALLTEQYAGIFMLFDPATVDIQITIIYISEREK